VNICSDQVGLTAAVSAGANAAATALEQSTSQLSRCGQAIRQLVKDASSKSTDAPASDGSQWRQWDAEAKSEPTGGAFEGLFAVRRSTAPARRVKDQSPPKAAKSEEQRESTPSKKTPSPASASPERGRQRQKSDADRRRGPGWQRLPSHGRGSRSSSADDADEAGSDSGGSEGLGEWAPSAPAVPPSKRDKGLSYLWLGGRIADAEPEDGEGPLTDDAGYVDAVALSPRTISDFFASEEMASTSQFSTSTGGQVAAAQVSKGKTLRDQLEQLRAEEKGKAAQEAQQPAKGTRSFFGFGQRRSTSAPARPGGPASTLAEDKQKRAETREKELKVAQLAVEESGLVRIEEGELELAAQDPKASGSRSFGSFVQKVGSISSARSAASAGSRTSGAQSAVAVAGSAERDSPERSGSRGAAEAAGASPESVEFDFDNMDLH